MKSIQMHRGIRVKLSASNLEFTYAQFCCGQISALSAVDTIIALQ
jgi:hypothetical protein